MSLVSAIQSFIGWPLRGRPQAGGATKRELLATKPIRNPAVKWADHGDEVVLTIPLTRGRISKHLARVLPGPETKRIALDEVGGFVWRLCDGQTKVESICAQLAARYNLDRREAEASMFEYLKQLGKRGLVVARAEVPAPAEAPVAAAPARKRRRKR
ncbi:MAG TPA: PqqD family protein [Armatimonadota bacterium]|jgi:hypothetical protein